VPLTLTGGDHPIAWCQNWDGGRAFLEHPRPRPLALLRPVVHEDHPRRDRDHGRRDGRQLLLVPRDRAAVELAGAEATGTAGARAELAAQARALREWMQQRNSAS
jgi:hypothetical protein